MHCNSKNLRMNVKKYTFLFFCCSAMTRGQCVTVGAMGCVVVETNILVLWRSGHARSESFRSQDTSD